eukprot:14678156-Alexandrium_andersonii.AAC.1
MELLRARGREPSSSARKLFSVAGSQGPASQLAAWRRARARCRPAGCPADAGAVRPGGRPGGG